jgi:hypothetical protein
MNGNKYCSCSGYNAIVENENGLSKLHAANEKRCKLNGQQIYQNGFMIFSTPARIQYLKLN